MNNLKAYIVTRLFQMHFRIALVFIFSFSCCYAFTNTKISVSNENINPIKIGWSIVDITPEKPVLIKGQFPARVSEGVLDPVKVTALAMESGSGTQSEKVIMISCDLVRIDKCLLDAVRDIVKSTLPEVPPENIVINSTHTHASIHYGNEPDAKSLYGIALEVLSPIECLRYISVSIAQAAKEAWNNRQSGGISYGLGHAVVGHQRIQVDHSGKALMYGSINRPEFSHMEGFEDHSVKLLYTWDRNSNLTGIVINLVAPSQVTEHIYQISADFWHDTRVEINKRLGKEIYILPQSSPGGGLSPHVMVETRAEERMQKLMFPDVDSGRNSLGRRKQIAWRIADAVTSVLPYMKDVIEWEAEFSHEMEVVNLSRRRIPVDEVETAMQESKEWEKRYEKLLKDIENNPDIRKEKRWYTDVSRAYRMMLRGQSVKERYEMEKIQPEYPAEIHVVRIGDIVFATNPFELYLDFGTRIIGRSPAVQTFLVQFTNGSSSSDGYLPPQRAVAGGAYGAVPASGLVGPEGGEKLVAKTLEMINNTMK